MQLIVKAKIKDFVDQVAGERLSISSDFGDELNEKLQVLIKDAIQRAKANGRKTLMAKDV